MYFGVARQQVVDNGTARRLAHIVRVGFEGQSPDGKGLAGQAVVVVGQHLVDEHAFLPLVDRLDPLHDARLETDVVGGTHQGLHVFWKARTPIAGTGIDEVIANAGIGTDTAPHRFDVRPETIGQVG